MLCSYLLTCPDTTTLYAHPYCEGCGLWDMVCFLAQKSLPLFAPLSLGLQKKLTTTFKLQ